MVGAPDSDTAIRTTRSPPWRPPPWWTGRPTLASGGRRGHDQLRASSPPRALSGPRTPCRGQLGPTGRKPRPALPTERWGQRPAGRPRSAEPPVFNATNTTPWNRNSAQMATPPAVWHGFNIGDRQCDHVLVRADRQPRTSTARRRPQDRELGADRDADVAPVRHFGVVDLAPFDRHDAGDHRQQDGNSRRRRYGLETRSHTSANAARTPPP